MTDSPRLAAVPVALVREAAIDGQPMAVCVYATLDGLYGACLAGIWPGQNRLAVQLGIGRRTVQRALEWLHANGWVSIIARIGDRGERTTNLYELHPDAAITREWNTPEARARARARIDRELYTRAAEPVDNSSVSSGSSGSSGVIPRAVHGAAPAPYMTHNPYLPSGIKKSIDLGVVENPDAEELERVRAGPMAAAYRHTPRGGPRRPSLEVLP